MEAPSLEQNEQERDELKIELKLFLAPSKEEPKGEQQRRSIEKSTQRVS